MPGSEAPYDAIVVGSGAAGSWAAKELTEGGLSVVLLEAGRNLDIPHDFPADAEMRVMGIGGRIKWAMKGQHIQVRCSSFAETTRQFYVSDRDNPYTTARRNRFLWFRGRQLGGRLHTWWRHVPRMSNYELKAASVRGDGLDWPLSYEDLAPYYDVVERTLGVYGENADIANCPDGQFIGPAKTTKIEEAFRSNVEQRLPDVRVTYARKTKYDTNRVPLPVRLAMATGRLEIRTDAVVSRLLMDAGSGKATGVEYVDRLTKETRTVRAKVVVLCASAIESVRILLNSKSDIHPAGVGGSSGHLGRYLCDHVAYTQVGTVPEADVEADLNEDGFDFGGTGLYIPSFCEKESPDFPGGYGIQLGVGRAAPVWIMSAFGEMQPRYENHVSLDTSVKDAWGIPVARIQCAHSPSDVDMVAHMKRKLPEIASAGGLPVDKSLEIGRWNIPVRRLQSLVLAECGALWPGGAIHETGGARMGDEPENSVLNSYCQCWDADNVFVTDGACFVSPGFQNPTLTMMALTVRACRFIVDDYVKSVS
ncbi:GMC oxidoreductase [Mycobacterium sp. E2479]|uniref:GMC oxidoreductase n=1 Tax=Mycobacterium sp. E2479 TaxID=1834134 RepID=UPI0008010AAB|nr:GMC family oxidoreductase [Mycobacterium sp. E2479]OBH58693.1 glucose-methanol-choline oxidoreductase [Mycobacterium sp. E2479]